MGLGGEGSSLWLTYESNDLTPLFFCDEGVVSIISLPVRSTDKWALRGKRNVYFTAF